MSDFTAEFTKDRSLSEALAALLTDDLPGGAALNTHDLPSPL